MFDKSFKDWHSFTKSYREELSASGKPYDKDNFLFRGQMDSRWSITSSFDRIEKDKSKSQELIDAFKISLQRNQHPLFDNPNLNDDMIAAFGQHHGLPTRLIDWSVSPYIAAFFAFSDALINDHKGKCISIWAINKQSEAIKKEAGSLRFIEIPNNKINQRLKSQMGQFTYSNHPQDNLEDYLNEICLKHGIDDALWKFNLPNKDVQSVLNELDLMNINYESIYPDIEGFIKNTITTVLKPKFDSI